MISIRDYIYLDIERLKSIYSQALGGLVETVTKSGQTEKAMSKSEEERKSQVTKDILLGEGTSETRVMHDYLFTEVEKALQGSVIDVTESSIEQLRPGMFIRICGVAELDDTTRLLSITENYNEFYGMVLVVGHAQQIQEQIWDLEEQLEKAQHKNQKDNIQHQIDGLSPASLIRKLRMGVPQLTIDVLKKWISLLYNDIFEIKIKPSFDNRYVFRAILDKHYLREDSTILYAKYGSRTQVAWTLMGQVTSIHDTQNLGETNEIQQKVSELIEGETEVTGSETDSVSHASEDEYVDSSSTTEQEAVPNIKDAIENLFDSVAVIEQFLRISSKRKTWIITPLAIYHETPPQ